MTIEAMKQALEALETERDKYMEWGDEDGAPEEVYDAITTLRAAIEQAEKSNIKQVIHLYDEPPAAPVQEPCQYAIDVAMPEHRCVGKCQYAAQRQWVGLTEDELGELMKDSCGYPMCPNGDDLAFARAIEAKLREKNGGQA